MNKIFSNNLKKFRQQKNYTQEYVAEILGVSSHTVSRWECNTTLPDVIMLPQIAKLYCVTIDDLFKESSVAYENYAQKLLSVYETTHNQKDFIEADREFEALLKSGKYTMKDICLYAILYQFHLQYCKDKALELFDKGQSMGVENDPQTYYWIERQRMLMHSQTGNDDKNISEQKDKLQNNPDSVDCHINLIAAYFFADENEKALEVFNNAVKKFKNSAILYTYGGDIYRRLKKYKEAFNCWNKAIELDLNFTAALHSKASCYEELGNYKKAYETWLEAIEWYNARGYEIEAEEPKRNAERCKKLF